MKERRDLSMARPILSEYGPDAHKKQAARAKSGGVKAFRDVMGYRPPTGPTSIDNRSVGLGGDNYGNCGVQGPKAMSPREGGGVGLGGENKGMGMNRRGR
jgi:hypothetical protein